MKLDSESSSRASSSRIHSNATKRTLQALIRAFKVNNFHNFRSLPNGVCYVISLTNFVCAEVATFPLVFSVQDSVVSVKIYFSRNKSAHSFADLPGTYNLEGFIEKMNEGCKTGQFEVEGSKRLVYLRNVISLRKARNATIELINFANESVGAFVEHIGTLSELANGTFRILPRPEWEGGSLSFLHPQESESTTDSETAMLGLKIAPRSLVEIDYEAEVQTQATLKERSSNSLFAWDLMEIDEASASARFLVPKNCISFDFFLGHSQGRNCDLLNAVQHIVDTLTSDGVMVDDLYDRLYVVGGASVVVNPVSLHSHLRTDVNYTEFWRKVVSLTQTILRKQNETMSHTDLWARIDPLWKIEQGALEDLSPEGDGFTGKIGTLRVRLVPVECGGPAQLVVERLAAELHNQETRRYGVVGLRRDEFACYLVKDM